MPIRFYSKSQNYFWLSNFSKHGFVLQDKFWPTVEHFFQAQKFPGHDLEEEIRLARTPAIAKRLGRSRSVQLRKDWEKVKEGIMKEALHAKFTSHQDLAEMLLETGNETLIEAAPNDYYWGCGETGTGRNRLGVLLMEIRKELRK